MEAQYFQAKAREVFAQAGGDPDKAGDLAVWAQGLREADDDEADLWAGALVSREGEIIAHTTRVRKGDGYIYQVNPEEADQLGVRGGEVRGAINELMRVTGQRLIHIEAAEISRGGIAQVPVKHRTAAGIMPGATFAAIRANLGLTGEEMGEKLGVTSRTVRSWESGDQVIRSGVAADALDLLSQHVEEVESLGIPARITVSRGDGWSLAVAAQLQRKNPDIIIEWK